MSVDLQQIQNILTSQLGSNPATDYVSSASANINNLTKKRVQDWLSKMSTTGMGRSGISAIGANEAYATGDQGLSDVAARGEQMDASYKQDIVSKLLNLGEYQDQKPGLGDYLGSLAGQIAGTGLGAGTASLAKKWLS